MTRSFTMSDEFDPAGGRWEPIALDGLARLFRQVDAPWWVAGGVALDLFVGRPTREHGDLDVEILRRDLSDFAGAIRGWSLFQAKDGRLRRHDAGEPLPDGVNGLWCRPTDDAPWVLELLLADADGDAWRYRRDHRISRLIAEVGLATDERIPFIAPEIQLLYKSKNPRATDQTDIETVLPLMNESQRAWLASALGTTRPGHTWLEQLG